jgi:hypothetical protein
MSAYLYVGERRPEESRSLILAPVSASCALRISLARSTPGGVPRASFRRRGASSERRLSRGSNCFEKTSILHGALSLGIGRSATGVLITDKSHVPGCDKRQRIPVI